MAVQQVFAVVLAALAVALAAARAAARSLVGLAVVVIGEDIAGSAAVVAVVGSIAAGVAGQAAERTVHCLEAVFDVEGENTADKGVPI